MKVSWHVWRTHQLVGEAHNILVTRVASLNSQMPPFKMKLEVLCQAFLDGPTYGYIGVMVRAFLDGPTHGYKGVMVRL